MEKEFKIRRRDFFSLSLAGAAGASLVMSGLVSAQESLPFYFPETGHNLEEPFLSYWRKKGGRLIFGDPISEVIGDEMPHQYFQKARMELHPDNRVMLGLLGSEIYQETLPADEGFWHPKFARFYNKRGGLVTFGYPISSPFYEEDRLVQVFERAKFKYNDTLKPIYKTKEIKYGVTILSLNEVELENLGEVLAQENNIPTQAVEPKPKAIDFSLYDPYKNILVDQKRQLLTAYEDGVPVIRAEISSGRPTAPTIVGNFSVLSKRLSQAYDWWDEYENPYYYEEVPFNLLFDWGGYFIHTAYWHENFGLTPGKAPGYGTSRGCINTRMDFAQQIFEWAPVGTPVEILSP